MTTPLTDAELAEMETHILVHLWTPNGTRCGLTEPATHSFLMKHVTCKDCLAKGTWPTELLSPGGPDKNNP